MNNEPFSSTQGLSIGKYNLKKEIKEEHNKNNQIYSMPSEEPPLYYIPTNSGKQYSKESNIIIETKEEVEPFLNNSYNIPNNNQGMNYNMMKK